MTAQKQDAHRREVRKVGSRWPVTVAAILAVVALVLVVFVALRRHQNNVVSFSGIPSEVVIESSAGLVVVVPAEGDQVQVSRRATWTLFKPEMSVQVEGGSLVVKADCVGPVVHLRRAVPGLGAEHGCREGHRRGWERADRGHRRPRRCPDVEGERGGQ